MTVTAPGALPGRITVRGERLVFAVLYFAEGVPIGFIWWALPSILREHAVDIGSITALTAALAIPWTLKFLAGPVVDRSVARGGRLSRWILVCQALMGLMLLPLAASADVPGLPLLAVFLVAHACCAAVQDVAIDALCIRAVPVDDLGGVNGWMQFGMTAGRAVAAASVPLLIHAAGWQPAIVALVALIWLPMLVIVLYVDEVPANAAHPASVTLRGMFEWALMPAVAVALLAGAGFEAVGALAGPMLVDLDADATDRALFFGAIAPAGLAFGGLVAARAADGLGLRRSVAVGVLATVVAVGVLASITSGAGGTWRHAPGATAALGLVYACAGFLISSSYACFMSVARGPWGATRFSLLMAATNACESGSAFAAGRLAMPLGYGAALFALAAVSLVSLPFLRHVGTQGARGNDER